MLRRVERIGEHGMPLSLSLSPSLDIISRHQEAESNDDQPKSRDVYVNADVETRFLLNPNIPRCNMRAFEETAIT